MRAQRRFGLDLSWPRLTAVFLIDVAVLALVSHLPDAWQTNHIAWWAGVAVAALVTIVAVVTYRRTPLTTALAARVLDRFVDPEMTLTEGCTPAIDHQRRYGRDVVGIREYDGQLVAVIAVDGQDEAASGRHRNREAGQGWLPVEAIAARLRQFDVRLDAIDIVSVGTRHASGTKVVSEDEDETGPLEDRRPFDEHHTWLVLRMDPQRNVAAVAARDSVASTLAAAVERLAHDLDGRRWRARPLTSAEIDDMDATVLAGLQPAHVSPRRRRLKYKQPEGHKEFVTSFWVSPRDITSETLERLWMPDTEATAVTLRLTPRHGGAELSAWVRYHTSQRLRRSVWSGLNRLTGRQLDAVCASMPVPARRPRLVVPGRELRDDEDLAVLVGQASAPSPTPAVAQR
ncbi:type VII secretion protein EccE [uncultured Mycobacterium sp.]|uniref:type VII secretion protein EccE n=1 Tax=uncultured Mycobacterium sp. TaxID=171292 RepID=UPI0035CC2B6E